MNARKVSLLVLTFVLLLKAVESRGEVTMPVDVSPSGAATYDVPIIPPPAANGMQPRLTVGYNSQAGNGMLGVGWRLGGLSVISRCPQTKAQDQARRLVAFDANDKFCLDGKKLINVAGTYGANEAEYRPQLDAFKKVFSYTQSGVSGVAYFTLKDKDGNVYEYGKTADSRVEVPGATVIRSWALNKATDAFGNYLTITYGKAATGGEFYPDKIEYGGNGSSASQKAAIFEYQKDGVGVLTREDAVTTYQANVAFKNLALLKKIRFTVAGQNAKEYRFTYKLSGITGRNVLSSVAECAGDVCLPPVVFTPTAETRESASRKVLDKKSGFTDWSSGRYLFGDFNGDGLTDMIQLWNDGGYAAAEYFKTGYSSASSSMGDIGARKSLGRFQQGVTTRYDGTFVFTGRYRMVEYFAGDFTGDGLTDILRVHYDTIAEGEYPTGVRPPLHFSIWANTGNGFKADDPQGTAFAVTANFASDIFSQTCSGGTGRTVFVVLDYDGDGRSDFAQFGFASTTNSSCQSEPTELNLFWGNGTTLTSAQRSGIARPPDFMSAYFLRGDFNGDGLDDVAEISNAGGLTQISLYQSTGTGLVKTANWWNPTNGYGFGGVTYQAGDFNGDGKTDLVQIWDDGGKASAIVFLSTGTRFEAATWATKAQQTQGEYFVGDFDGDGMADVGQMATVNGTQSFISWLSRGNRFETKEEVTGEPVAAQIFPGGFSGDQRTSLLTLHNEAGQLSARHLWMKQSHPDLVKTITDPLGRTTDINYSTLIHQAQDGAYGTSIPSTTTVSTRPSPMRVVQSINTALGGTATKKLFYTYDSAQFERGLDGLGFLGVNYMMETDYDTGLAGRTYWMNNWPYLGMVKKSGSGKFASSVWSEDQAYKLRSTEYGCIDPMTGAACAADIKPYQNAYVYPKSVTDQSRDTAFALLPGKTTTIDSVDVYGNPLIMTELFTTGRKVTTTSVFGNDATGWKLGRLLRKTTVTSVPDAVDSGAYAGTDPNTWTVPAAPPPPPIPPNLSWLMPVLQLLLD